MRRLDFIGFASPAAGANFVGVIPPLVGHLTQITLVRAALSSGAAIRLVMLSLEEPRMAAVHTVELSGTTLPLGADVRYTWGIGLMTTPSVVTDQNANGELPSEWYSEQPVTVTINAGGGDIVDPGVYFRYVPITKS